jgi:hypothetical protein
MPLDARGPDGAESGPGWAAKTEDFPTKRRAMGPAVGP